MLFVLLTKILLMKSYDDKISVVYLFIKIFGDYKRSGTKLTRYFAN